MIPVNLPGLWVFPVLVVGQFHGGGGDVVTHEAGELSLDVDRHVVCAHIDLGPSTGGAHALSTHQT